MGYRVGNLDLGDTQGESQNMISNRISSNENFEIDYHHSNAFLQIHLK